MLDNKQTSKISLYFLMWWVFGIIAGFGVANAWTVEYTDLGIKRATAQPDAIQSASDEDLCGLKVVECDSSILREVSAYNIGDPAQTDSSPCIGATGENLCAALDRGEKIVATNELPLHSKVEINGEVYVVKDRMNKRFNHRYDIAFKANEKSRAINFGIQILNVKYL